MAPAAEVMDPQPQDAHPEVQGAPAATVRFSTKMPHDSMVTVRLSEPPPPPALTVDTNLQSNADAVSPGTLHEIDLADTPSVQTPDITLDDAHDVSPEDSPRITMMDSNGSVVVSPLEPEESTMSLDAELSRTRSSSLSSASSREDAGVNWEELEKTEEQEPRDEASDESTALLLARLEQENNMLATNPKSGMTKVQVVAAQRNRSQSRPPSIQHLKKLVNGPTPSALRYSMIPPPPMTDLEFYGALVQDYARTAQCLPTLLSKKIRSGVPPPLRGVVWQSMAGARDRFLEEQFDRLCGESSPYEGIIGKDLGRSFPGVEMFRDPEGDGQLMLGRVLKCFSLYDSKIGYCQGLGFLVGPLLMHMGDKQAFCVLVRLMEHYDLRACYLPDLSGLHVRIHQFSELLKHHLPTLNQHLEHLQIEPGFMSQWFLSFFAVTCPLPMLFRIYDVIFAEGASETIMRVALSLMRKNEQKILACSEFEDVMQLLLSRGLWDVYNYNADDFVNDFVSLTGVVTRDSLQALEQSFKARSVDAVAPSESIGTVATRFLGRLWAGSTSSTKSANLSPGLSAPARPTSFIRRSPSKQSLASTLNSVEGGSSDSMISASTEGTSISRDSSNTDSSSSKTQSVLMNASKQNKDSNLHGQIEDLLTALSEMQRDHAILATQLQREREERDEDRTAVRSLLDGLRKKTSLETVKTLGSDESLETIKPVSPESVDSEDEDTVIAEMSEKSPDECPTPPIDTDDLSALLELVEDRFAPINHRRSSMMQSKSQLREELARSKEQLIIEVSRAQDLNRRLSDQEKELSNLRDQLKESHTYARNAHADKQRLEKQLHDLRARKSASRTSLDNKENELDGATKRASGNNGGLRQLKLGRTNSHRAQNPSFSKRTSSLNPVTVLAKEGVDTEEFTVIPNGVIKPDVDSDAIILELVQAKTAEAVARQEAEEYKAKLESLKKMLGMGTGSSPASAVSLHRPTPSVPTLSKPVPKEAPPTSAVSGGFWGGWGKRTVSATEKTG